jgi:uncharacterized tellurite resistance protein B-like protein
MIKFNKYAFAFLIIYLGFLLILFFYNSKDEIDKIVNISLLLILIANAIYLKNRWCHPKVNKGNPCKEYSEKINTIQSIIGLLVIVAYADKKLDDFEKSLINHTIEEFSKEFNKDILYKLLENIEESCKNEYIEKCLLENYKIRDLIGKFCTNLRNIDKNIKIILINKLIDISTASEFNKCQYNTIKYIANLLDFSSDYVDNILKQLGFYETWFESDNKNNSNTKNFIKRPL